MRLFFFTWKFSNLFTRAFLFCGAVKVALQFNAGTYQRYGTYILKRITKIYIPFLCCTLIYYGVFVIMGILEFSWPNLIGYLLRGDISAPFYYVILVMQYYLLRPFWHWMLKRIPCFLGIPAALLLDYFAQNYSVWLAQIGISSIWGNRLIPFGLSFWVMGLYIGYHYSSFCESLQRSRKAVCLLGAGVIFPYLAMSYCQSIDNTFSADLNLLKLIACGFLCLVLLCLTQYIYIYIYMMLGSKARILETSHPH